MTVALIGTVLKVIGIIVAISFITGMAAGVVLKRGGD